MPWVIGARECLTFQPNWSGMRLLILTETLDVNSCCCKMLLCCTERLLNSNTKIKLNNYDDQKKTNFPNSNSSLLDYWHLFYCGQEFSIELGKENILKILWKNISKRYESINDTSTALMHFISIINYGNFFFFNR